MKRINIAVTLKYSFHIVPQFLFVAALSLTDVCPSVILFFFINIQSCVLSTFK